MASRILVIGSSGIDLKLKLRDIPLSGETTVEDGPWEDSPGGHGAQAALALKGLGADAVFCGCLGGDNYGRMLARHYSAAGLDTRYLLVGKSLKTGLLLTIEEEGGVIRRCYFPGASPKIPPTVIDNAFSCVPDSLYMQMDLSDAVILRSCENADEQGAPIILDGAGLRADFPFEKLPQADVFSLNIEQTRLITKITPDTMDNCLRAAIKLSQTLNSRYYVIKLGEKGAYIYDGKLCQTVVAYDVRVADRRGAGVAFTAAMAFEYTASRNILRACKLGAAAAALCISKPGPAAYKLPTDTQLAAFIRDNGIVY